MQATLQGTSLVFECAYSGIKPKLDLLLWLTTEEDTPLGKGAAYSLINTLHEAIPEEHRPETHFFEIDEQRNADAWTRELEKCLNTRRVTYTITPEIASVLRELKEDFRVYSTDSKLLPRERQKFHELRIWASLYLSGEFHSVQMKAAKRVMESSQV